MPQITNSEAAQLDGSTHSVPVDQRVSSAGIRFAMPEEVSNDLVDLLQDGGVDSHCKHKCTGMEEGTCLASARRSPLERRDARQVGSILAMRSTSGRRATVDGFRMERRNPR